MRNSYRHPGILLAAVSLAVSCSGRDAPAQYGRRGGGFGGAAGTPQGDILRGMGMAAMGMGQYNLTTAMAGSINTDTAIRWNEYVYQSIQNDLHQKYLQRQAHFARNDANYRKNLSRIRTAPNPSDVRSGDALNSVLVQLLDPRISPSNYRRATVPLSGDTIKKIPFQYSQRNATFSIERLTGKQDWPLRLRDPEFASFRRDYERAIDHAIERDIEGKLSSEDVRAVAKAVADFEVKVEQTIRESETKDIVDAKNYLKHLAEYPRMLQERAIERVIAEIDTYPGTTVGDLIMFMQRHNLRFGVAESPNENVLYAGLFDSLVQQREQVTLPPEPEQPNQ